ncbi:glycerophosphodiester phosphodiesterase [Salisediminibacterium halotolerans]|uniref:glycerophosphodiester phosphodiesterase n=1 Tax=Salisediminibacterium halotolerans TaxID=517425 RepID=UPI000EB35A96|nr:glycerophosphodiester phosphodiesterase family protein [Salisediminibacterium halotolerans]RLJ78142.1 glycerophosphoryl diester phosphodiesterase [Actinophytocola xinjiangensis]RPE88519.1 glycerophosphoryl diester phosphodiesterase [Salisediminibacterium halotolerans]TWG37119.1 glycerophosphoryl diester phosphodiesterase [Salisediminibacterium halotolerans]GEL07257.1 glycerophosphoryl diester phosphodiesterase [Salisediminibacterium halotolerans]
MHVIAHRGNKKYTPENTMAAFYSAEKYNVDGIEFDLQWTKDDVPVVHHDPTIDRTTDGSGKVRAFTLQELKQFDAGRKFDESFRGEKIPRFSEVLTWAKETALTLHVELKEQFSQHEDFVQSCINEIKHIGMTDRVVISTFYHPYLALVKKQAPEIETALLTKTPVFRGTAYAEKIQADGIHIRHSFQAARYYRRWNKQGTPVRVYNIQTVKAAKVCRKLNVSGIITNDPRLIAQELKK